jgi:OOP family OmpA-OmpF porin
MKGRIWIVSLLVLAVAGLMSGCGAVRNLSQQDSARADAIAARIAEARGLLGEECAPRELARADVALEWARHEAMEYEKRAKMDQYFVKAEAAAEELMAVTKPCWEGLQDDDGDGVLNYADRCPGTPRGVKVDARGCPLDSDGDGVTDDKDQCPDTPRGVKVDTKGCPLDSDGDGVPDYRDKCPNTPKGVRVDASGCPLDTDGDGVPDYRDKCPNTPKGARVDSNGCPLDSDGDGVPDYRDKCPNTPRGTRVDSDGCPIPVARPKPAPKVRTVELLINFDFDSDVVKPEYMGEVRKVADFLKRQANLDAVIEGHTDSVGAEMYNLKLSARRANSVAKILNEQYGIDLDRVSAQSLGESQPIASNDTEMGRAKNRRVYAHMEAE